MKGLTPMLVLQALVDVELPGLAIVQRIRDRSDDMIEIAEGTIYPLLYRLEGQRHVAARWMSPPGGRRQRVYAITDAGRRSLAEQRRHWHLLIAALKPIISADSTASAPPATRRGASGLAVQRP